APFSFLFPYSTLFRPPGRAHLHRVERLEHPLVEAPRLELHVRFDEHPRSELARPAVGVDGLGVDRDDDPIARLTTGRRARGAFRSEEHTSELQSRENL